MYKEMEYTVTVEGSAETKEGALAKAFGQIKNQVSREVNGMVFRIEPVDATIRHARQHSYKERFLGLFFPRIRTRYEIRLSVKVRLVLIEVEKIPFEEQAPQGSALKRFLHQQ